ncbi:SDR family NAD(P)-dependent oxidoreductase [Crateriforma spongiae]|uniref:SDR family NAD(P)-dependent oxidoreductase n=1 Tax=Crateriforma spongiae TaxID=2724528 RepID=UPI0014451927|nr:SDR family oxidoreductase [Crateriforma spongiae]
MSLRFENKRVFVTAASVGIGYEISRQFAAEGAIVGLNARRDETTAKAVEALRNQYPSADITGYPCDVADVEAIQGHVRDFSAQHGGLDVMVANAGITVFAPFLKVQPDEFDYLMNVNMRGTYFSVQEAAKQMIAAKTAGRIVLMSSVCGMQSHAHTSSYGMTKAAIRHLAISLADELGPHGITVNVVSPGATLNERTSEDQEYADGWASVCPSGRVGNVGDVAYATLFLADQRAGQITGENIVVDGGWSTTSPLPKYLHDELKGGK